MKAFRVTGKFRMGGTMTNFSKEYTAADKKLVEDKALADLGSKHRVKRKDMTIEKVEELTLDKIQDTSIRQAAEGK
jgi:large subunit ribosomal protein LX